jgi:hypothetical protein
MRPQKATAAKLLRTRDDLSGAERSDLAAALSRWSRSAEHAQRIVSALPEHPSALDIRRTAERTPASTSRRRPRAGCPYCFGSGFSATVGRNGYSGVQACSCIEEQPELAHLHDPSG